MKKTIFLLGILSLFFYLGCSNYDDPNITIDQLTELSKEDRESLISYTDNQQVLRKKLDNTFTDSESKIILDTKSKYYNKLYSDYHNSIDMISNDIKDSISIVSVTQRTQTNYFLNYHHLETGRINILIGNNPEIKESIISLCRKNKNPIFDFHSELINERKKYELITRLVENKFRFETQYDHHPIDIIPDSLSFFSCLQCLLIQSD